ncbi:MFS transporter [Tersicoccus solisilvae]|uniref:MFS transporter n=1 Tax=Tersicoccus solisilvae TaxID=1882339 RepID=A0ABQ1PDC5_9MICC|nr:MFS transporter [Tersicoccus solisilvae]GGC95001.1 MFS transporter [Tersicoccus solisilvae]
MPTPPPHPAPAPVPPPADRALPAGSRRRRPRAPRTPIPPAILVLIAAAFVIALGFGLVAPVLPQLAHSFDVGTTAAAAIVSVFALARLVFAPAGGRLVERLGERPVYVAGLAIVGLSSLTCAFATDYVQLLLFRGLGGLGSTMFTVSALGLIVRLAPAGARGRISSYYAGSFLLGNIAGPVVGGVLGGLGLRVPFVVYGLLLLATAAFVFVRLRAATGSAATIGGEAGTPPVLPLRTAFGDSAYRAAIGSSFANGWGVFGVRVALVPLFATAALGAGPALAGAALAIFAVGNALALPLAGRLTDAYGRRPLVLAGLATTGIATMALGLVPNVAVFIVASIVAGVGAGLLGPAQQAAVADVIGPERSSGRVLAAFQMAADTGTIIGPLLAGFLVDTLSYGWAFAVTGAVCLLAMVPWLVARETLPATTTEPAGS